MMARPNQIGVTQFTWKKTRASQYTWPGKSQNARGFEPGEDVHFIEIVGDDIELGGSHAWPKSKLVEYLGICDGNWRGSCAATPTYQVMLKGLRFRRREGGGGGVHRTADPSR
jgi:hypothetical protein